MAVTLQGAQMLQMLERSLRKYLPESLKVISENVKVNKEKVDVKKSLTFILYCLCVHACVVCVNLFGVINVCGVCTCMNRICVCMKSSRLIFSVFLDHSSPYILRQGLLVNLELTNSVSIASQVVQENFPDYAFQALGLQAGCQHY